MNEGKKYYYENEWRTLAEIARMNGMSWQSLYQRIKNGMTLAEAISLPRQKTGIKPRLYDFAGEQLTLKEIADKTGIKLNTLRGRLYSGMSIVQATKPHRSPFTRGARKITFAGKTLTIRQWAEEIGISTECLRDRLSCYRWTLERALTQPKMSNTERAQRRRNSKIIARMLTGFHAQGGAWSSTFSPLPGTGVGRHETHFEGISA